MGEGSGVSGFLLALPRCDKAAPHSTTTRTTLTIASATGSLGVSDHLPTSRESLPTQFWPNKIFDGMAFVIARLIALPAMAAGSVWLIVRYRALGFAISILAGWAILFAVYRGFPAPPDQWDEDGEEIQYTAPILMALWCIPVWAVVVATSRPRKPARQCDDVQAGRSSEAPPSPSTRTSLD